MSFISRLSWFKRRGNIPDEEVKDISEILRTGRSSKRRENLKFTGKTRGKSATTMFGRRQLREAILHCVVNEEER
jgi:hypothetical protein